MSCCNKKVSTLNNRLMPASNSAVRFMYTGKTSLSAVGSRTGKRYSFLRNGDVQMVDYRDVAGMQAIATLKKL